MKSSAIISKTQVFFRSFLVQAFWNFERIQNLGFAYCIYPFLHNIYPDKEKRKKALLRHLEFFCTHPYMVNLLLGLVVSMEEKLARNEKGISENQISQIKSHLSGPLAALGDSFFWHTWRSFCVIIASSLFFFGPEQNDPGQAFLAVFLFLVMYNMLHIPVRWFGFSYAYKQGMQIIATIERFRVLNWGKLLAPVGIVWITLMLIAFFIFTSGDLWYKLKLGCFFVALYGFKHDDTSAIRMVYIITVVCVLLSYIGAV